MNIPCFLFMAMVTAFHQHVYNIDTLEHDRPIPPMPQKLLGCVKIAGLLPPGPVYGPSETERSLPLLLMLMRIALGRF